MNSLSALILSALIFLNPAVHKGDKIRPKHLNNVSNTNNSVVKINKHTAAKQEPWRLGIALYAFHTFSFPKQLALADSAGVKYVEGFSFADAGPELKDSTIMQLSPGGINKIKKSLRDKKIKMTSIFLTGGDNEAEWEKQFKLAKQLNVEYVTAEPAVTMWNMVDSLAGVYKLKVAIHNHWKGVSAYWSPDSVLAAIKNHPNFGACPDLGHWPKSGIDPVEGLKKLQGHIIGIHLKDIAAFNRPDLKDVPIGKGVVNFPAVFKELKRQNYKGYLMIERDAEEKPSNLASVIYEINYYHEQVSLLK
ncbi:Sugar phosphate isomerase/epimerase [Mucilaginibacter pineti]|uniref:Sugar phosphate isomerase/epimerase n=1 Tax=Mucilaginibacter pineti TaxID=1391627 RepID=A0A1G7M531_9SPHI|nr:sugar phosphate isomerase/epimerase family protein [Mucilaginibacter pineti]SDF56801.1 Sugar phosphate isomerase/epimerase [Mucilaginibacter pineti]